MGFELKRNEDVKVDGAELKVCTQYLKANFQSYSMLREAQSKP